MGPYSFIHLKSGRNRAPPRRSETSSSLALAMGMPESSFWPMVRDRVSEVSQSGLTHELGLVLLLTGSLESEVGSLSMEDFMERERGGSGEREVGLSRGVERSEREERESEKDMVRSFKMGRA
ncbi:hypothetical protein TorRG33x02_026050 [Trema orientale]|uniref:Uncharacterized protein n=1 Tax=Trema orientale TaxID=63057 RepID=A0A2P5FVM1_TREOI|nr:hypothetical protein TorRG33x02_026050 [Trema orientale]